MAISAIRRTLEDIGSRLFRRDHPNRSWRPGPDGGLHDGASPEERALYRCFAVGIMRQRAEEERETRQAGAR